MYGDKVEFGTVTVAAVMGCVPCVVPDNVQLDDVQAKNVCVCVDGFVSKVGKTGVQTVKVCVQTIESFPISSVIVIQILYESPARLKLA